MKRIDVGDTVALLMDIKCYDTPFFSRVGSMLIVHDVSVDPSMPSGYSVEFRVHGGAVLVDRSAVIHVADWSNIYNAVLKDALNGARKAVV